MKIILLLIGAFIAVSQFQTAEAHIDNVVGKAQDVLWELQLFCSDEQIHELAILIFGPLGVDYDWFLDWLGGVGPFKLDDRENLLHDISNFLELYQGCVTPEEFRCVVNEFLRTFYLDGIFTPEEVEFVFADNGLGGYVAFLYNLYDDTFLLPFGI